MISAQESGYCLCPVCHKINQHVVGKITCTRCRVKFHSRKKGSLQVCLAWTLASMVMLFPANLMPIMIFTTLNYDQETTVLSGIQALITFGMYPIAVIVFIASFIIPIGKIVGLLVLVHHVKAKRVGYLKRKAQMYRLIEFLGPWSMLDVFVVTLMAAVVSLDFLTTVSVGPGLTYFALMVVFTMFAAHHFDPRLIWDKSDGK